ncbi:MAG: hypothetical protein EZS28_028659 [Streblomastix strix]|uniref:B30.2/SPRY domain-containing protein n=1 Tax=Streblomastix strix TaxID=222440 RepID=A0A5J4V182_9EUKA|nr:MAG: hypothetical protein EZS28_028659 [Streblomastix strix]
MERSTYRSDQTAQSVTVTGSDIATIIPHMIQDLESDNTNLHVPALRRLLDIILDNPGNYELILQNRIIPLMNKFTGNINQNEEFALSTTIVHLIGVRGAIEDKTVLVEAATEPLIRMIHQSDEKISKCGSKALGDLIEENEIIRHSLLSTGFAQIVLHTLSLGTQSQQSSSSSSSSSQTDSSIPIHVKNGILDVLFKLIGSSQNLEALSVLIPILEQMKTNGEQELKNKAKKILGLLSSEGITFSSSSSKEKDERIQLIESEKIKQGEEINKMKEEIEKIKREKDEENVKLKEEIEKEKKRADETEEKVRKVEQEKEQEKQEKEKKEAELKKLNEKPIIAIINPDPTDIEFADVDGTMKKISKKLQKWNTVSLTQVMDHDIWSMEVMFNNTRNAYAAVGIVRDTFNIPAGIRPRTERPQTDNIAIYQGQGLDDGHAHYKGSCTEGNTGFQDNQIVKMELDFGKGTLIFFLDGTQQPVYFQGIKEKVRFVIAMEYAGSVCTIRSLKKLLAPTSGHVANEKSVQW